MPAAHITAAEIDTMLRTARKGANSAADVISRGDGAHWLMLVLQQNTANPPEMHAHEVDIYIPIEGTAQLTLDGEISGATEKSPGQFIGGKIVGGRTITLSPGDVVHLPAMTPHQLVTGDAPYKQFVVKIDLGADHCCR